MVSTKIGKKITINAYQIPEYVDPSGPQMPPWDRPYIISSSIVERMKWDFETLAFYQMADDSMSHRIKRGDLAIVDTADRVAVRDGAKYLIQTPAGAKVRWIFVRTDGGLTLAPDSGAVRYRPEDVPAALVGNVRLVGRIVCVISFTA